MSEIDQHPKGLPATVLTAYHLAALAYMLPGADNAERDRLKHMADLLNGVNPNIEAATAEALRGALAARQTPHTCAQPEVWLLNACAQLLATSAGLVATT